MCWADKCCFFFKLDVGCIVTGVFSFIFSTIIAVTTMVLLFDWEVPLEGAKDVQPNLWANLQQYLSKPSIRIVLWIALIFAVLWMAASVMLLFGVSKRIPGLVLAYFSYGICVTIMSQLSALLVLLGGDWPVALFVFFASMIHVHVLVVVHTVYENLQRGKVFGFSPHDKLEEDSICDNDSI